jgi:hypothetical protein
MKNILSYSQLNEGDPWDNDPNAPWNQEDPPEPEAYLEYKTADQPFDVVSSVPDDIALLKKKSDGSLWVLDTTDLLDEGGDFDDYIYYVDYGEDSDKEKAEDMEDESYSNILVDLYKEKKYIENGTADAWELRWDDDTPEGRLYKLNPELAEHVIHDLLAYTKTRTGSNVPTWQIKRAQTYGEKYRNIINIISRAFPEED